MYDKIKNELFSLLMGSGQEIFCTVVFIESSQVVPCVLHVFVSVVAVELIDWFVDGV